MEKMFPFLWGHIKIVLCVFCVSENACRKIKLNAFKMLLFMLHCIYVGQSFLVLKTMRILIRKMKIWKKYCTLINNIYKYWKLNIQIFLNMTGLKMYITIILITNIQLANNNDEMTSGLYPEWFPGKNMAIAPLSSYMFHL